MTLVVHEQPPAARSPNSVDPLLRRMREAREAPVVHKTALAKIRATAAHRAVLVCEGVDDKKVYFHWLRQVDPDFGFEFLICNGKAPLLEFRELLRRDLSGLSKGVSFLIDRDFDGLRGHSEGGDLYVSDTYSFENVLVTTSVLENILSLDFHCHGDKSTRDEVLTAFESLYEAFLDATEELNYRLYLARRLGIGAGSLPQKIKKLANVTLEAVAKSEHRLEELISLEREPTDAETEALRAEFEKLNRRDHYRGKFAFLFFTRWVELLGDDRNSEPSVLFKNADRIEARARGQMSLDSICARSRPPHSFKNFIQSARDRANREFSEN